MKFDPTTHRFRVAYWHMGIVVWPITMNGFLEWPEENGYENVHLDDAPDCFTRAPEHDLIPRADVIKLVEALKEMREHFVPNDPSNAVFIMSEEALAEFQKKHGG